MSALLNNKLRSARTLLQQGDIQGAAALCAEILRKAPRNPEALALRGTAALMAGDATAAAADLRQALIAMPRDGNTLEFLGLALLHLGEFAEAETLLRRALALPGAPPSVGLRLGLALLHQGRPSEAVAELQGTLLRLPDHPDVHLALGQALAANGDAAGASAQFSAVLRHVPAHADALYNLGVLAMAANETAEARRHFEQTLNSDPRHADAMVNLAILDEREGAIEIARQRLEQALSIQPGHALAHANLGHLLLQSRLWAASEQHFEAALAGKPDLPAALEGLGAVARAQSRHDAAIHWLRLCTATPDANAGTWVALGDSLLQTGDLAGAEAAATQAAARDPALAAAWSLRAQCHVLRKQPDLAITVLEEGVARTGSSVLLAMLAQQCRHVCDWARWAQAWQALKPRLLQGEDCSTPFALLSEDLTPAELLDCTRAWAQRRFGERIDAHAESKAVDITGRRIRIGYFSSDFQDHPAAWLLAELFELHDRTQFEIHLYSYGPPDSGAMRQRLIAAVDHFADIAREADDAVVRRIRDDGIDILVDLKGYTLGDRLEIMAQRPTPVQITWLGYPGTTGTRFIDYLIADDVIVPAGAEQTCSEQVLRLPQCYQPIDNRRVVADPLSRAGYGLPETGLVFCCFNQTFKITPEIFSAWMRVLAAAPDSVLWLVDDHPSATANLRAAAIAANIAPERLVFAPRKPLTEHLARYRVADLALDTFPYTSHTTASDALWCGCPLIALCGETFAARVSASILTAAQLPALIAHSINEYETKILKLASHPALLEDLKRRVRESRATAPLFDTTARARDLEAVYRSVLKHPENAA